MPTQVRTETLAIPMSPWMEDGRTAASGTCWKPAVRVPGDALHREVLYHRLTAKPSSKYRGPLPGRSHTGGPLLASWAASRWCRYMALCGKASREPQSSCWLWRSHTCTARVGSWRSHCGILVLKKSQCRSLMLEKLYCRSW